MPGIGGLFIGNPDRVHTDDSPTTGTAKTPDELFAEQQLKAFRNHPAIGAVYQFDLNSHSVRKTPVMNIKISPQLYWSTLKKISNKKAGRKASSAC
jgi:hypothetical protein